MTEEERAKINKKSEGLNRVHRYRWGSIRNSKLWDLIGKKDKVYKPSKNIIRITENKEK